MVAICAAIPFITRETLAPLSGEISVTIQQESLPAFSGQVPHDPWFAKDKFLHFSVSAAMPGFLHYLGYVQCDMNERTSAIGAVSVSALIGIAKECYDRRKKNHFSWRDLLWDGLGLTIGYFVFIHDYQ